MNGEIKGWVSNEFETLNFNSSRLEKRFMKTMSDLSEDPEKSLWLAAGSRINAKAAYRMLANEKFDKASILSAHRAAANSRSKGNPVMLAVQDSMSVNYNTHSKTEGLGYNCEQTLGINVHSCLLLTPDGTPLGLLDQSAITREKNNSRDKTEKEKCSRPIAEKESHRWLETMQTAAANAPKQVSLIHIADREGDIYELYALAEQICEKFIIRAVHDRIDTKHTHIIQSIRDSEVVGRTIVTVASNRKMSKKEREVELIIQYKRFDVKKPRKRQKENGLKDSLDLTLIRLAEINPPENTKPLEWLLVTNLDISSAQDALLAASYYKQRWKIERFHFVLKSGCTIEKIQQRSVRGIEFMVLMYSIIAIHIMMLTFLSRNAPETPCNLIFEEIEWQTLYRAANRTQSIPEKPPSMKDAVRFIAKLGGFAGAPSDGHPGLKVLWIGLNSLLILMTYRNFI